MNRFNYKKAVQALNYFAIKNGGKINKMKALKLIWLSDRLHIRKYGRTITGDMYFAMKNGPVASGTKDILQNNPFMQDVALDYATEYISSVDNYNYKSVIGPNTKVFSKSDLSALDAIFNEFGHLDHFAISDKSHNYPEWVKYSKFLNSGFMNRVEIDEEDFFLDCKDHKYFVSESDEVNTIKDMYLEYQAIESKFK